MKYSKPSPAASKYLSIKPHILMPRMFKSDDKLSFFLCLEQNIISCWINCIDQLEGKIICVYVSMGSKISNGSSISVLGVRMNGKFCLVPMRKIDYKS